MIRRNKLSNKSVKSVLIAGGMSLGIAASGILAVQAPAAAEAGKRLCYEEVDGEVVYFKRQTSGVFGISTPCSDDGAKDVPTLRGVDYSKCEQFGEWKLGLGPNTDVCLLMEAYERYTIEDMKKLVSG